MDLPYRWNGTEGRARVEVRAGGSSFYHDYFEPLGQMTHPFGFYGLEPALFDAPHTDELENALAPGDWDDHVKKAYPDWNFARGFHRHPLDT